METNDHLILKYKALQWLYQVKKCKHIALEIAYGRYIFDVVGTDGSKLYIIEAKQSREDFLRECNKPEEIKENIEKYKKLLIETGDKEYKKLMDNERNKSFKFYNDNLKRLSSFRYIIAKDGIISESELPESWGLINEEPRQLKDCVRTPIRQEVIPKIIYEISKKNTKMYMKSLGVNFDERVVDFPNWELYLKTS